jgi:hypothetical protein
MVLQADVATGYLFGNWSVANFNTGTYEIVLHSICSTLGFANPGVDDYYSYIVEGTIQLVDTHLAIASSYPPNMGTGRANEEFSATFNVPVDCDKNNGNYWFDVNVVVNGSAVPSTFFTVFCEDRTIYIKPNGNGVCLVGTLVFGMQFKYCLSRL